MPRVSFTRNLQRHVPCPPCAVEGGTVRECLDAAFGRYPGLRGYVLDEHGALRFHMAVFVDGEPVGDRRRLADPVAGTAEIYVMQALSGG
ncbi:MAG: MoaD/ThiS family protein [Holophagaceae bacterium]